MLFNRPSDVFDAGVHVTILWGVLLLFFVLYISKVEKTAFSEQFGAMITSFKSPTLHRALSDDVIQRLLNSSSYAGLEKLVSKPESGVTLHNQRLFVFGFALLFALLGATTVYLFRHPGIASGPILKRNALSFSVIAVIEFLLFTFVASKYDPTPPSAMVDTAIAALQGML